MSILNLVRSPRSVSALSALFGVLGLSLANTASARLFPPLKTVDYVDLVQYSGLWYEISHAFAPYEEGCVGTTAEYTVQEDGTVRVLNACYEESFDGPLIETVGVATVANPETNAKLTVSFPTEGSRSQPQQKQAAQNEFTRYLVGNYWIIDLGPDYSYTVVSDPTRISFWVLSRTPTMDEETYAAILADLESKGFDTSALEMTDQTP